jgi:hypothetical protein
VQKACARTFDGGRGRVTAGFCLTPVYYLPFKAVALYALDRFDEAAHAQTGAPWLLHRRPACELARPVLP